MTTNSGRIFKVTSAGVYTNMHTFNSSTDGYNAFCSLIQGTDGNLYGTCSDGGQKSAGTIFQMSLSGTFKVLRVLDATVDGRMPKGSLLQGADGNLYGTTSIGGTYNSGTIFKISTSGNYTVLHHMNIVTDGGNAYGSLIFGVVNNLAANTQTSNVNEDSSVKITLTGSGGSSLTYTVIANPAHGKLTGTAPKLTYKPNKNYNGNDQFSFIVSVGCTASSPAVVNITVKSMPDSPVLAPIGNKTVKKDSTLKFKAKATDADSGQTISYSLIGAPSGATINKTSGAFTWTPTIAGSFSFKVRATDNGTPALYDEETITVTVTNTFTGIVSADESNAKIVSATKLFPNPAKDVVHITLQLPVDNLLIRIVDLKGNVVSINNYNDKGKSNFDVDVSNLSRGFYVAQLEGENLKTALRFIKE